MALQFLLFDASDDGQGHGSWEAMASVKAERWPALQAEAEAALREAERSAPGPRGPQEDGGTWDAELQVQHEGDWTTLTLTFTGPWDWGEALVARMSPPA